MIFDQISNKALGKKLKVSAVAGTQLCCALDIDVSKNIQKSIFL